MIHWKNVSTVRDAKTWTRMRIAVAILTICVIAVVGMATIIRFIDGESPGVGINPSTLENQGWRAAMHTQESFSNQDLVLTINEEPGTGMIAWVHVIDAESGKLVASVQTSSYPMAVLRDSNSELLVSDVFIDDQKQMHPRLLVLDLLSNLKLKRSIELPDRANYPIFANALALSEDERYLYYTTHTQLCEGAAESCDHHTVEIINLEGASEVASAELPLGCGFALLLPSGRSDMLAMCPGLESLLLLGSFGSVTSVGTFEPPTIDRGTGPIRARPVYAGIRPGGEPYMIFEEGTVGYDGGQPATRLLPPNGGYFSSARRWRLDERRVILGFDDNAEGMVAGAVLFDSARPGLPQLLQVPAGTTHLAPVSLTRAAVFHDGLVSTIDLNSGEVVAGPFDIPAASQNLVGTAN